MKRSETYFELLSLRAGVETVSQLNSGVSEWCAGEDISGHRIVYPSSETEVKYADKDVPEQASLIIGITTCAADEGAKIKVQTKGLLIEPSWNWQAGLPIFLGNNGMPTQDIPTTGFMLEVGVAVEPTSMYVFIRVPVVIEGE